MQEGFLVTPPLRRVLVATACYTWQVYSTFYVNLVSAAKALLLQHGIDLIPMVVNGQALIQLARNEMLGVAYEGFDDIVFVDADVAVTPEDLVRLLSHDVPFVGAAVAKKIEGEDYSIRSKSGSVNVEGDLWEVDGLATGLLRIRKDAIEKLCDSFGEYVDDKGIVQPNVCAVIVQDDGRILSEDFVLCERWKQLGGKVYVDPALKPGHFGTKCWESNAKDWASRIGVV